MTTDYHIPTETHLFDLENDLFHYSQLSKDLLENVLLRMDLPNCFGIYGNWGAGKTSLIHFLKKHLEENKDVLTVYFEAWKYEYSQDKDLLFALMKEIEDAFEKTIGENLKDNFKGLLKTSLAVGMGLSRTMGIDPQDSKDDLDLLEDKMFKEHERWRDVTKSFQEEFLNVIRVALKNAKKSKLFIIVDDLDRCLPESTIKILEAIKHFLSVENTLFIFAIDRRAVSEMIQNRYGLYEGYGDEYLMKIIHYNYELPKPDLKLICDQTLQPIKGFFSYSEALLANIAEFYREFSKEPRKIKHFLNHFVFRVFLSEKIQKHIKTDEKAFIAVLVIDFIVTKFPKLFVDADGMRKVANILNGSKASKSNGEYSRVTENYKSISWRDRNVVEDIFRSGLLLNYKVNIDDLSHAYDTLNDYRFA